MYAPGTRVLIIDDFTVENAELWPTVGRGLLDSARARAASRDARLTVVVCGHLDEPKRTMLRAAGLEIASEWYVSPL